MVSELTYCAWQGNALVRSTLTLVPSHRKQLVRRRVPCGSTEPDNWTCRWQGRRLSSTIVRGTHGEWTRHAMWGPIGSGGCARPRVTANALQPISGVGWEAVVSGGLPVSVAAAFAKVVMLACFVGWLLRSGRLYDETAPVCSQVVYNVVLPAALVLRLAASLAGRREPAMLLLPLLAALQVGVGAALGRVAGQLVEGGSLRSLLGWHPRSPAGSAQAIALATAAATGVSSAADALMAPPPPAAPRGTKDMVMAACAFGSCWALPLAVLEPLFSAPAMERAARYAAWSAWGWLLLLWTWGYHSLVHAAGIAEAGPDLLRKQNAPFGGGAAQVRGGSTTSLLSRGLSASKGAAQGLPTAAGPSHKAPAGRGESSWAKLQLLAWQLRQAANPPLVAGLCGVLIGITPLEILLLGRDAAAAHTLAARLPFELWLTLGVAKAAVEVGGLCAAGYLALQGIVLGAAAFDRGPAPAPAPPWAERARGAGALRATLPGGGGNGAAAAVRDPQLALVGGGPPEAARGVAPSGAGRGPSAPGEDRAGEGGAAGSTGRPSPMAWPGARWVAALLPREGVASRALAGVLLVRGVLLPLVNLGVLLALRTLGRLPADPVLHRLLLLQGSMPPAQSLVTILSLRRSNRGLASELAALIVRAHLLLILPTCLWCGLFWNV